jgi:hypothetical protein
MEAHQTLKLHRSATVQFVMHSEQSILLGQQIDGELEGSHLEGLKVDSHAHNRADGAGVTARAWHVSADYLGFPLERQRVSVCAAHPHYGSDFGVRNVRLAACATWVGDRDHDGVSLKPVRLAADPAVGSKEVCIEEGLARAHNEWHLHGVPHVTAVLVRQRDRVCVLVVENRVPCGQDVISLACRPRHLSHHEGAYGGLAVDNVNAERQNRDRERVFARPPHESLIEGAAVVDEWLRVRKTGQAWAAGFITRYEYDQLHRVDHKRLGQLNLS